MNDNDVSLADQAQEAADTIPPAVRKLLEAAEENGWKWNGPGFTLVGRLHKPDDPLAKPFFMRWDLNRTDKGKWSYRFNGARASNGQPMNLGDVHVYLKDTSVIYPEPPTEEA